MPRVGNWQLGRDMDYPYEGSRPERQFCMIMDTNKCIACQSCTIAWLLLGIGLIGLAGLSRKKFLK